MPQVCSEASGHRLFLVVFWSHVAEKHQKQPFDQSHKTQSGSMTKDRKGRELPLGFGLSAEELWLA